ncbi:HIT family hydrolase [archaeon]|jgi:histidine triad (HIT) family protein|nr:HIT family hydrolase [archaeon]|tara:strand:- start:1369 stop:1770 length:402 start_codon:yes stop_codon:yes gene_type:complete
MADCIFCKIVKGEIPCHKVYEDDSVLAFLDIAPCSKGHTVVIPKQHGETVFEFSRNANGHLMGAAIDVMKILKEKVKCQGFNVGWNHGKAGGQAVSHVHVHVIPRYEGDQGGSMHSIVTSSKEGDVDEVAALL